MRPSPVSSQSDAVSWCDAVPSLRIAQLGEAEVEDLDASVAR